jgi:hypothetical protein
MGKKRTILSLVGVGDLFWFGLGEFSLEKSPGEIRRDRPGVEFSTLFILYLL